MAEAVLRPPRWLSFLPSFLFSDSEPKGSYVFKAWLLALVPSLVLSTLVGLLAPTAARPDFPLDGVMLPITLALLVIGAPLIETLLMVVPLLLLERVAGFAVAVVASALGWAILHSLAVPTWGLVIWWPFLILSIAFLTLRRRGMFTAILLTAVIHGLQNSVAAAAILASRLLGVEA